MSKTVDLIKEQGPEFLEGAREMQTLAVSIGMTACKFFLNQIINHTSYSDEKKTELRERVANFYGDLGRGCLTVNTSPVFYVVLEPCGKDHSFDNEINKIKSSVPDERWPEVLHFLSVIVFLGRNVYRQVATQVPDLFTPIRAGIALSDDLTYVHVDTTNTTLYLVEDWTERIGIKIYREDELPAGTST
jgi:hypothetical protein